MMRPSPRNPIRSPAFAAHGIAILAALALICAVPESQAQIKLTPPSGQSGGPVSIDPARDGSNAGAQPAAGPGANPGAADPADPAGSGDAGNADQASSPDLLSQYEKSAGGKPRWVSKLLGLLGAGGAPSKQGAKAYADGDYDKALQKFAEARLDNPENQALAYNIGNAEYRKKKYDDAIQAYKKALHGDDAGLASAAYYNLGNAHFRKGEFAVQNGKQEGIEDYREAMAQYKKSLEIRPDNKDAKRNIEVVQARIKELLEKQKQDDQQQQGKPQKPPEPSEKAKEILARAMQLVQERRYAEAKALLEDLLQKDKTAVTYQSFVQRIDDVLKILRGEAPTPPRSQDPRASQPGVGVI
ncbi:MAG: Tetratricopeptide repeat-containing protein [Fibrobacteres bacterium]|nr:Tetratricopeptide repeat-containing protein [Fibrobacterota bacterium]